MLGPYGIAPMAQRQLAAWQDIARNWPVHAIDQDSEIHLACGDCGVSLMPLRNATGDYHYNVGHFTDATVSHLRACHADVEPAGL